MPRSRRIVRLLVAIGVCFVAARIVTRVMLGPPWYAVFQQARSPSGHLVAMTVECMTPSLLAGGGQDMNLWVRRAPTGDLAGEIHPRGDDLVVFSWNEHNITNLSWASDSVLEVVVLSRHPIEETLEFNGLTVRVSSRWSK